MRYLNDDQGQALAQQSHKVVAGAADPAGTWRWLLPDVNANVATHLSDSAEVLEQAAFEPYGRPEKAGSSQPDKTKQVAQIGVTTDKMKLAEQAGLGKFKSLTEFRAKLVRDDAFSIRVAAAYLRNLQAREGVTGRRAFIAYAYSPRGIAFLGRYRFSPRAATADALACGGTCSDVSLFNNLIGRHYTYEGSIGGARREFDDGS